MKRIHLQQIMQQYDKQLCVYEIDICNKETLDAIVDLERPDLLCHLAALAGVCRSVIEPEPFVQTNILGTVNVLEMAKKYGISHCVFASSSSVYGDADQIPCVEDQKTDLQINTYGITKKSLELFASMYCRLYGISCTCLRLFTVYGPRGRFDMAPFLFMDAIYHDKPITVFGDGTSVRDFIYITDVVDGIVQALKQADGFQIYNLGSDSSLPLSNFIQIIEEVTEKKAHIVHKSLVPGDVYATYADSSKARNMLEWQPTVFVKEGMEKMYEWYKKEYLTGVKRIFQS
jgi:UDP-glucuronate 4-epimerase